MKKFDNQRVLDLIAQMNDEEKLLCVHGQLWDPYRANQVGFIRGNERLGIPDLFLVDGESGVSISWETTAFPSKVSLASTFDRRCAFEYGKALGREAKATGIHMLLTPRVNIARDPVSIKGTSNGGNYQTYGEDPVLNGEMGAREAEGIQYKNQAMANLKQLFGSSTGAAQGAGNCVMDQQTIHELYMRPYELVMRAGVASAMTNYNQINGVWTYDYGYMMDECARNRWGFKGFIFDDWFCLYDPNAIRHGVTIEMPGEDYYDEGSELSCYGKQLLEAIHDPEQPVTMEDLDRAVYYYLDTLDRFGILDEPQRRPHPLDEENKMESARTARRIAGKGAVLLKNEDNILPMDFAGKKVAVIGPGGYKQAMPTFKESPFGFEDRKTSVYDLLKDRYKDDIVFAIGNDMDGVPVPAKNLYLDAEGREHGLKRYIGRFTYETLCDGSLDVIPEVEPGSMNPVVDADVNFYGKNALPVLPREQRRGFFKETPKLYYMWHGYICPDETGMHRVSLQSKFPGLDAFERNQVENGDLSLSTSGNLYIREVPENECLTRVGIGVRVSANGMINPFSEVVTCADGWNNAGSGIYLEAGKKYEIYFNHTSLYLEPVEVRLAWTTPSMAKKAVDEAVAAAANADVVLCFAWHQSVSDTMELAEGQSEMIAKIAAQNPNTIVVLNNGDALSMPWRNDVKAILEMWFSGQEGALATMDILTGAVNPAGRLPVTFPEKLTDLAARDPEHPERYAPSGRISEKDAVHPNTAHFTEGLLNGYRWLDEKGIKPMYEFGFGLSYTTFAYSDLEVWRNGAEVGVRCVIENTGNRDGEEVVQCYLGRPDCVPEGIQTVPKMLVDFCRAEVKAGEKVTVEFKVDERYLQYFDSKDMEFKLFKGTREVLVGASSRDIRLSKTLTV